MSDFLFGPSRLYLWWQRRLHVLSNVSYTNEVLVPSLATLASSVARFAISAHVGFFYASPSANQ